MSESFEEKYSGFFARRELEMRRQGERSRYKIGQYKVYSIVLATLSPVVVAIGVLLVYPGVSVSGGVLGLLAFIMRDWMKTERDFLAQVVTDRLELSFIVRKALLEIESLQEVVGRLERSTPPTVRRSKSDG